MFRALFAAIARLTASINRSAELFEGANDQLAERLAIDPEPEAPGNGNHRLERLTAPAGKGKRS